MSKDNKPKLGEVKLSFFNRFAEAVNNICNKYGYFE